MPARSNGCRLQTRPQWSAHRLFREADSHSGYALGIAIVDVNPILVKFYAGAVSDLPLEALWMPSQIRM
jgi:hypothetical protein